ncbi:MAG: spore coat protein CotJB [Oscillospiraceae bacterium]|nr:spore coat protein CotJB [Oscillospiraceae bacterium]
MANNCGCQNAPFVPAARPGPREHADGRGESSPGCALMRKLMTADFYLQDLKLYLDTHPCDEKALCLYRKTAALVKEYRAKFEEREFPLTDTGAGCKEHVWDWLEGTWPPARV